MNVWTVLRESLRRERRTPWTWGLPIGLMNVLIVAIYPSIQGNLKQLSENYPQSLKEAFGISEFDSIQSYLHAEMYSLIIPLALGYFAVRCIAHALAVAEEQGQLDVVLSAPVRRGELVAGAFLGALLSSVAVLVVVLALTLLASAIFGVGLSFTDALAGNAAVWPLAAFFAGVAALATGWLRHSAAVTALSAGALVAMYVIDLAGRLADSVSWLQDVTVFKYYGAGLTDGIDPLHFVGLAVAGAVLAAVGAVGFERRDIRT